jgi:hypothetical protein
VGGHAGGGSALSDRHVSRAALTRETRLRLRVALAAWAIVFATQSWYYAAGGTWGGSAFPPAITRPVLERQPGAIAVLWLAGAAKLGVAAFGVGLDILRRRLPARLVGAAGWLIVAVLATYEGFGSLVEHALMLTGVITLPPGLGRRSAWWHLLLFDPYWLLGGLLLAILLSARGIAGRAEPR